VPVSSVDTRNVLESLDDPYREESVLVSSLAPVRRTTVMWCQLQQHGHLVHAAERKKETSCVCNFSEVVVAAVVYDTLRVHTCSGSVAA
jgi:hypothetical protein